MEINESSKKKVHLSVSDFQVLETYTFVLYYTDANKPYLLLKDFTSMFYLCTSYSGHAPLRYIMFNFPLNCKLYLSGDWWQV